MSHKILLLLIVVLATIPLGRRIVRNQKERRTPTASLSFLSNPQSKTFTQLRHMGEGLIRPYSLPVALSADGKLLLVKEKTIDAFALKVYQASKLKAKMSLAFDPWEIAWSPYGNAISFLAASDSQGYDLYVWWLRSGQLQNLGGMVESAAYPMKWSPDNQHIAYVAYQKPRGRVVILAMKGHRPHLEKVIDDIDPDGGLAWSGNGEEIIFARSKSGRTSLEIYSLRTRSEESVTAQVAGAVRDLSWSPSRTTVALSFRGEHANYWNLAFLIPGGRMQFCVPQSGDVKSPVWADNNSQIEYLLELNSDTNVAVGRGCDLQTVLFHPRAGSARLQNDGYNHSSIPVIEARTEGPPQMWLPNGLGSLDQQLSDSSPTTQASVRSLWIHASGYSIPAWLWPGDEHRSPKRGAIIVHGGPRLHETAEWEPLRQAFHNLGYFVLAPNYSGSSGYGNQFESVTDPSLQTTDVIDAIRYLSSAERISPENIVVIASSYGTRPVLEALRRDPDLCGTVIFSPFLAFPQDLRSPAISFHGMLAAFHGKDDLISDPQLSLQSLQGLFPGVVSGHRFYWREFDHEGHGFGRIASLQEQFGTITCIAEVEVCRTLLRNLPE